jgi:hypothetical protein
MVLAGRFRFRGSVKCVCGTDRSQSLKPSGVRNETGDGITPQRQTLSNLFFRTSHFRVWDLSCTKRRSQPLLQELHSSESDPEQARFEGIQVGAQEIHRAAGRNQRTTQRRFSKRPALHREIVEQIVTGRTSARCDSSRLTNPT